jgi:hypothetical protein
MDFITEPEKQIPVIYDVDVAVAGGGIAGTMAALAAARQDARTVVIDKFGYLGGNMGPGLWAGGSLHLSLTNEQSLLNTRGMGGIPEELERRTLAWRMDEAQLASDAEQHFNVPGRRLGSDYFMDSQTVTYEISRMMQESGIEMLLSTYVVDPIMEGSKVKGLFVENKSGRQAVKARIVVDATGDADIARRAGAKTLWSGGNPGIGLFYAVGDVDWEYFQKTMKEQDELSSDDQRWMEEVMNVELEYATHGLSHLVPYARRAWEAGVYRIVQPIDGYGKMVTRPMKSPQHGLVRCRAETNGKLDPGDGMQISTIERRIREYIFETVQFFKVFVPGFSNCYLHTVAPYLGARGGRWIEAEYPISGADVKASRNFDDVIYIYNDDRAKTETDIPYRALIPIDLDGLIAAGRSAVPRSPNFRQRCSMLLMGQAAGVAAGLCAKQNIEPRELDTKQLQRILVQWGCPLGDKNRLAELGLV